jgi:acetylornithine/succinyldiaminopimelate/putrescine aminotransferase
MADSVLAKMKETGVWAVPFGPKRIRFVMHLDVTRSDCEEALERIATIFEQEP